MDDKLTYEQAMKRLEEIVNQIESGQTGIDQLVENLKEAKELVAFCKDKLTVSEAEVKKCLEL